MESGAGPIDQRPNQHCQHQNQCDNGDGAGNGIQRQPFSDAHFADSFDFHLVDVCIGRCALALIGHILLDRPIQTGYLGPIDAARSQPLLDNAREFCGDFDIANQQNIADHQRGHPSLILGDGHGLSSGKIQLSSSWCCDVDHQDLKLIAIFLDQWRQIFLHDFVAMWACGRVEKHGPHHRFFVSQAGVGP